MSHRRLVARDDKPGVTLAERPVQWKRLLAGDPEGDVDPAVEHAVDDRLGDGRASTALGSVPLWDSSVSIPRGRRTGC